ncbi:MAG: hypothetical protein U0441_34655 [Polyangiaceae bacterium]
MSGAYHLCATPDLDRPMHFTIEARLRTLRAFLTNAVLDIRGEIVAEGFADHKALDGTLCLDLFRGRVLVYQFGFEGNDGQAYSFSGRKTLSTGGLLQAMTVLPGGLFDSAGHKVATALLRFDLRSDLIKFLGSYRLVRS